jgi:hypothetical protein
MIKFTFDEEMIDTALMSNGWSAGWNCTDWCYERDDPDYVGYSKKEAFTKLLNECNLIPRDVENCWVEGSESNG